jgi:hypothetical protein
MPKKRMKKIHDQFFHPGEDSGPKQYEMGATRAKRGQVAPPARRTTQAHLGLGHHLDLSF